MFVRELKDCVEFMAADFSKLREILHPEKMDLKIRYSLAYAKVLQGKTTKPHRLKVSEVYYILEGKAVMYINDESCRVRAGSAVYIPPNSRQYIKNAGQSVLKFLCIVDPAWKIEDEEVEGEKKGERTV